MHKLTKLSSAPIVASLMQRLEEASIEALSSPERSIAEIDLGGNPSVAIWIARAEDLQRAAEILREVEAERTSVKCPRCRYDLRGHAGDANCPECGHALTAAAPDLECPSCGESVPAAFDVCWNCGSDLSVSDPDGG